MPAKPLFGRLVATATSAAEHAYPAGLFAAPHFHDHSYLTIILAGETTERFARRTEQLPATSVQLMLAGERHSNDYRTDTRCLHLEVDAMLHADVPPGPIHHPRAMFLGGRIYDEFRRGDDLAIEELLYALFAQSTRSFTDAPRWLARVIESLHDSFDAKVLLRELARLAGVHPAHLCREFHRRTGRTIGAYVRELRVTRACALLSRSDKPLAEIALACGFADQSHFATTFRRAMRVTPGQYRRESR